MLRHPLFHREIRRDFFPPDFCHDLFTEDCFQKSRRKVSLQTFRNAMTTPPHCNSETRLSCINFSHLPKSRKPWMGDSVHARIARQKHPERRALHTFTLLSFMKGDPDWVNYSSFFKKINTSSKRRLRVTTNIQMNIL